MISQFVELSNNAKLQLWVELYSKPQTVTYMYIYSGSVLLNFQDIFNLPLSIILVNIRCCCAIYFIRYLPMKFPSSYYIVFQFICQTYIANSWTPFKSIWFYFANYCILGISSYIIYLKVHTYTLDLLLLFKKMNVQYFFIYIIFSYQINSITISNKSFCYRQTFSLN